MSDRRNLPREDQSTQLVCRVGHETFHAELKNVSAGGAFFETSYLFDPTQEIRLAIELPGRGAVSTLARPMRFQAGANYRVGVAVCFVENATI